MMDTLTPQQRSERMRRVRSRDTKPEMDLRKLVWGLGHRYRKNNASIVGKPDIAFVRRKRAIFLHGCFWHRHDCPNGLRQPKTRLDFWLPKFQRNVARDAVVQGQLTAEGWQSLVVWECELRDRSAVEYRVREFLDA
jgi:DNA mismatch endonuclease (patch repair protein)